MLNLVMDRFFDMWNVGACGKFVSGDPDHQRQTWNFSKEEIKDPSRNEGCEKVGFEPGTPCSVVQRSNH